MIEILHNISINIKQVANMTEYATLRLTKETHQAIKAIAASEGVTMNKYFEKFVKQYQIDKAKKLLSENTTGSEYKS